MTQRAIVWLSEIQGDSVRHRVTQRYTWWLKGLQGDSMRFRVIQRDTGWLSEMQDDQVCRAKIHRVIGITPSCLIVYSKPPSWNVTRCFKKFTTAIFGTNHDKKLWILQKYLVSVNWGCSAWWVVYEQCFAKAKVCWQSSPNQKILQVFSIIMDVSSWLFLIFAKFH